MSVADTLSTASAFRRALADFDMLAEGNAVLVALSGGQDSVALFDLVCDIREEMDLRVAVAHFNHCLRPDADQDEALAEKRAREYGCTIFVGRENVGEYADRHGLNIEAAARRLRYEFLQTTAHEANIDRIAVGHTATDLAETLLMNLLRGTGMHGLASIPPVRDRIIRPLVYIHRDEIADYCAERGLDYRVDATNRDTDYTRNRIRLELLPHLEAEYGPRVVDALLRASLAARQELEWTEPLVQQASEECRVASDAPLALSVPAAAQLERGLLVRVLRTMCEDIAINVRQLQWEHWDGIAKLIAGESGTGRISLPGGWRARREYDVLKIERTKKIFPKCETFDIMLAVPGQTELPGGQIVKIDIEDNVCHAGFPEAEAPEALLDADAAGPVLRARTIEPGDTFTPLGMEGTKKVSDFLIDQKVPAYRRPEAVAVVDADDRILWLVGHRISEKAAVSEDTKQVYHLRITDGPHTDRMR